MPTARSLFALLLAGLSLAGCHGILVRPDLPGEVRTESARYVLRSDLSAETRAVLLEEAERMGVALDAALGGPRKARRREIIAFAEEEAYRRYLAAHLAEGGGAVGFYCDTGGECALFVRDPPSPDDLRVLRHELVHQALAERLRGRIPGWLEEGLAEALAHARAAESEAARPACDAALVADATWAALEIESGALSWSDPDERGAPPLSLPPPDWASGEKGYVMHFLFVRFLEAIGEGAAEGGALGRALASARGGAEARLDLASRFPTVAAVERAFHAFVLQESALVAWRAPVRLLPDPPPPPPAAGR